MDHYKTMYLSTYLGSFFVPYGQTEIKASRKAVALRLSEWSEMRKLVEAVNNA